MGIYHTVYILDAMDQEKDSAKTITRFDLKFVKMAEPD